MCELCTFSHIWSHIPLQTANFYEKCMCCIKLYYYNILTNYSDIDECEQGSAQCDHNCTNTPGSYFCTCMDGYVLESDHHTCTGNDYAKLCQHTIDKMVSLRYYYSCIGTLFIRNLPI